MLVLRVKPYKRRDNSVNFLQNVWKVISGHSQDLQGRIQDFSEGGGRQPQGGAAPNHSSAVSLQLHENENFTRTSLPKFDFVDPVLYKLHVLQEKNTL